MLSLTQVFGTLLKLEELVIMRTCGICVCMGDSMLSLGLYYTVLLAPCYTRAPKNGNHHNITINTTKILYKNTVKHNDKLFTRVLTFCYTKFH